MRTVKKQIFLFNRRNVKTMPGCLVSDETFSVKESLMNKIVGPPRKLQGLGNFCRFVEQSAKKPSDLGTWMKKKRSEGKRGEAGGSGGEAGGSGGKRGEAGGSGGKRGEAGRSGGKRGGRGGSGGKRGKGGVGSGEKRGEGDLRNFLIQRRFWVFLSGFCGLLWFCVCAPVFGPFGDSFLQFGFLVVKNSVLLVPSSVWLFSGRLTLFGLLFGDVQRKISRGGKLNGWSPKFAFTHYRKLCMCFACDWWTKHANIQI